MMIWDSAPPPALPSSIPHAAAYLTIPKGIGVMEQMKVKYLNIFWRYDGNAPSYEIHADSKTLLHA